MSHVKIEVTRQLVGTYRIGDVVHTETCDEVDAYDILLDALKHLNVPEPYFAIIGGPPVHDADANEISWVISEID